MLKNILTESTTNILFNVYKYFYLIWRMTGSQYLNMLNLYLIGQKNFPLLKTTPIHASILRSTSLTLKVKDQNLNKGKVNKVYPSII